MSQLCQNLDISRPILVSRYIQIYLKLRHPFIDGGVYISQFKECQGCTMHSQNIN
jgi:hypothetical protein